MPSSRFVRHAKWEEAGLRSLPAQQLLNFGANPRGLTQLELAAGPAPSRRRVAIARRGELQARKAAQQCDSDGSCSDHSSPPSPHSAALAASLSSRPRRGAAALGIKHRREAAREEQQLDEALNISSGVHSLA